MTESQSTSTPRLSDVSSAESPNELLDPTASISLRASAPRMYAGKPSGQNTIATPGSLDPLAYVSEELFRKTPDSEVLASSDDENDPASSSYFPNRLKNRNVDNISTMSSRRPSYAAEFSNRQRGFNNGASHEAQLGDSNPSSPLAELNGWPGTKDPQERKASINLTWSAGSIWNPGSSRKNAPKGLVGTILNNTGAGSLYANGDTMHSPTSSLPVSSGDLAIPVPPNPQPRNYRSMSFSVGQRELEDQARPRLSPPAHHTMSRVSGLHHRPSRPSLLSEQQYPNGNGSGPLMSVFETPDQAEERSIESPSDYMHGNNGMYTGLTRSQYESLRNRQRTVSGTSSSARTVTSLTGNRHINGVRGDERFEDNENALADDDEIDTLGNPITFGQHRVYDSGRRFSEAPRGSMFNENHRLDTSGRQQWQNHGMSFPGEEEYSNQSRRHSFAGPLHKGNTDEYGRAQANMTFEKYVNISPTSVNAINFDGPDEAERRLRSQSYNSDQRTGYNISDTQQRAVPNSRNNGIVPLDMASMHGPYPSLSQMNPRPGQLLYLVSFKACRADVFFVQEGTGLRVKNGDLVIVEADRGTDLGTVTGENVTWNQAKALKEEALANHYDWLMMFSNRRPGGGAAPNGANGPSPTLVSGQNLGDAAAMGQNPDPSASELKPKMIKRLAQVHEIQTLRDKEANEAKAKRVCQQKVLEHRLPMEILDAEFQMDWKKLTFYYFADAYINFNSLVTDLFKIYKTRIWMSAMNPASFAHASIGGIGGIGNVGGVGGVGSRINPGAPILQGVMGGEHLADVALQHHFNNLSIAGLSNQYTYAPAIPRALVPAVNQQLYAQQQQMGLPHAVAVYPIRSSTHGVVPHQDFSHLPQQQQNSVYYVNQNGANNTHQQTHEYRQ